MQAVGRGFDSHYLHEAVDPRRGPLIAGRREASGAWSLTQRGKGKAEESQTGASSDKGDVNVSVDEICVCECKVREASPRRGMRRHSKMGEEWIALCDSRRSVAIKGRNRLERAVSRSETADSNRVAI